MKTGTVTARAERLINTVGVDPSRLLCITFTNKAAGEMRERLSKRLNLPEDKFQVYTFHGFCNTWLRKEGSRIGLSRFRIMGPDEQKGLIWDIVKKIELGGYPKRQWLSAARLQLGKSQAEVDAQYLEHENGKYKNKKIYYVMNALTVLTSEPTMTYEAAAKLKGDTQESINLIKLALAEYYKQKEKQKMLDIDDLELKGIELFKNYDVHQHYDYVMADEIQDSSGTDLEVLRLVAPHGNIVAVGDGKQAIYGFRGSSASNLRDYIDTFSAEVKYLTRNFRSDKAIVELANDTMKAHPDKDMVSTSPNDGKVGYIEFKSQKKEVEWLVSSIKSLTK